MKTHISITPFQKKVYDFVRKIPKGKTRTYKEVAIAIGMPKAARAVGNALNRNPFAFTMNSGRARLIPVSQLVPCHRVVRSDGSIGGFNSGPAKKSAFLNLKVLFEFS
jgi:O-6-methylguanine DNA methyltransferase